MEHWTQESAKDFAYHLSLDFFTQLQDRFEASEMLRKELAEKTELTAGRISQIFNSPPTNPQIESLVKYARALGMKVSIVAYDDGDPGNDKGPVFSGVIAKCWEKMGKPRDLSMFDNAVDAEQSVNSLESNWSFNDLRSQKKKPAQGVGEQESSGGELNMASGL